MKKIISIILLASSLASAVGNAFANESMIAADKEYDAKSYKKASLHYRIALRSSPNDTYINYQLASCAELTGNSKEASKFIERAIKLDRRNSDAYTLRARLFAQNKDWMKARIDYQTALILNPDNNEARVGLASAMDMQGDSAAANREYDEFFKRMQSKHGKSKGR